MYQEPESREITRHFVNLPDRQVHYRLAGSGPPLLLLHQSPTSSAEMVSDIEAFTTDFTVIAVDMPGYGLSDPLPVETPELTDYAEALHVFLSVLGIDRILIYGFHTGAMLGVEFARLYPEQCGAVIVNGLVVLETDERDDLLQNYLELAEPTREGAHLPWIWARMRDQTMFFPWYRKEPAARMELDVPDGSRLHLHLLDFLRAKKGGTIGYRAAFSYPTVERIGDITVPLYLLNYQQDPLAVHPERLAEFPDCVKLREIFSDPSALAARARQALTEAAGPAVELVRESKGDFPGHFKKEIVNTDAGPVFVRVSEPRSEQAVLLLHDAGASSNDWVEVTGHLRGERQVLLVDLPGHGETGALHLSGYSAEQIADLLTKVVGSLNISSLDVVAPGAASLIAMAMAAHQSVKLGKLVLIDPWFFDDTERSEVIEHYAPAGEPGDYGQHLLEAWYFVRDSELFWPWYSPRAMNALTRAPDIEASRIQKSVIDVLKAGTAFSKLVQDLLSYDWRGKLTALERPVIVCAREGNGHEERAEKAAGINARVTYNLLPSRRSDWAPELARMLATKN